MNAGYLVGKWVERKLRSYSQKGLIQKLASMIGKQAAKTIVSKVAAYGARAAAGSIASLLGASAAIAGPLTFIIGLASGWL